MTENKKRYVLKYLGSVDVDSGTLMIGDPCYFLGDKWDEAHYDAMCAAFFGESRMENNPTALLPHDGGHQGKGIAFGTAWGDGGYPVYGIWDVLGDGNPNWDFVSNRPVQVFVDTDPIWDDEDKPKLPAWIDASQIEIDLTDAE